MLGFRVVVDGAAKGRRLRPAGAIYHIALNTWHSWGGRFRRRDTGLDHAAILSHRAALPTPSRACLQYYVGARGQRHLVSVYLHDPDGNSIELYYDRPRWHWFDGHGQLVIKHERLRVAEFLSDTSHLAPQLTSTLVHSGERPQ